MQKFLSVIVVSLGLLQVAACDQGSADRAELRTCEVAYGPSIVALGELSVSGDVNIMSGGDLGAVHGNDGVGGNGTLYAEADVFSATDINLSGTQVDIVGSINEGVATYNDEPAYDSATAAAEDNNNDALQVDGVRVVEDGELRLSGRQRLVVPEGNYYFENGISISGQSTLVLTGDVVFYVNGPVSMTGTTDTNGGMEYSLQLVSIGEDTIRLSGTCAATLSVHAPLADVSISGTTTFNGSVVAHDISLSGTTNIGLAGNGIGYLNDSCKRDDYE